MSRLQHLILGAACAALFASTSAHAASVLGQTFKLDATVDGVQSPAPGFGVAGSGDFSAGTADAVVTVFPTDFKVWWVDGDSFNLQVIVNDQAFNTVDLSQATITLSDLHFKTPAGHAAKITGATFNEADSPEFAGFFQSADNPTAPPRFGGPAIAVTDTSVAMTFENYSGLTVGDQLVMRYDVQTSAVPEPATAALLLCGLAGLGLARRSRTRPGLR